MLMFKLLAFLPLNACSLSNTSHCYSDINGESFFVAEYDCLLEGDRQVLEGYLDLDFETSIFYKSRERALNRVTEEGYWVEMTDHQLEYVKNRASSSGDRLLRVKIVGRIVEKDGFYGHGFTRGIDGDHIKGGIAVSRIDIVT